MVWEILSWKRENVGEFWSNQLFTQSDKLQVRKIT